MLCPTTTEIISITNENLKAFCLKSEQSRLVCCKSWFNLKVEFYLTWYHPDLQSIIVLNKKCCPKLNKNLSSACSPTVLHFIGAWTDWTEQPTLKTTPIYNIKYKFKSV